jgi:hypothetical protein
MARTVVDRPQNSITWRHSVTCHIIDTFANRIHCAGDIQSDSTRKLCGKQASTEGPVRRVQAAGLHMHSDAGVAGVRQFRFFLELLHIRRFAVAVGPDYSRFDWLHPLSDNDYTGEIHVRSRLLRADISVAIVHLLDPLSDVLSLLKPRAFFGNRERTGLRCR